MKFYYFIVIVLIVTLAASCRKRSYPPKYFYQNVKVIALCNAITAGNENKIDTLLKQGININVIGRDGMTPLLWALKTKNKNVYELILKKGGDPNIKITGGSLKNKSVMHLVCLMDDYDYLKITLKYAKRTNNIKINRNALWNAISVLSLKKVKMLVANGADIDKKDTMGMPPVISAGTINQWHIVYFLLQAGADPVQSSTSGLTLIHLIKKRNELMSRKGDGYKYLLKCAKLLKDKGIEVDVSKPQKYPEPDL